MDRQEKFIEILRFYHLVAMETTVFYLAMILCIMIAILTLDGKKSVKKSIKSLHFQIYSFCITLIAASNVFSVEITSFGAATMFAF